MAVMPLEARTAETVSVYVDAPDALLHAGVVAQLRHRSDVTVETAGSDAADVVVVVSHRVDAATIASARRARPARVVVVAAEVDGPSMLRAAEAGVHAVVRRSEATGEQLARTITGAAAGGRSRPGDLLGQPPASPSAAGRERTACALSARELDVLRLLAEGHSTVEIGRRLAYSERTIKHTLHQLTSRLGLRNRVHAVAYALRAGLI